MLKKTQEIKLAEWLCNALELSGILLVLFMALLFQIVLNELPCPLCLLQRVGFFGIALGFLMNLRYGLRPSHYAMIILSALFTSFVALRQIALHVVPGTGSYGSAMFGFHLYTWSFIVSMIVIIVTTILMSQDRQYLPIHWDNHRVRWIAHLLFLILIILLAINIGSVLLECGLSECPDNPVSYIV
jgi:disulfide bond formation protein DsbB